MTDEVVIQKLTDKVNFFNKEVERTGNNLADLIVWIDAEVLVHELKLIHRQKAEIERLTEKYEDKLAWKEVDIQRLTEENKELYKENTTLIAGSILERKDIAKDTAKEILQGFDKWLKQAISDSYDKSVKGSIRHGGMNTAFHEVKELVKKVAKEKGVEVE